MRFWNMRSLKMQIDAHAVDGICLETKQKLRLDFQGGRLQRENVLLFLFFLTLLSFHILQMVCTVKVNLPQVEQICISHLNIKTFSV